MFDIEANFDHQILSFRKSRPTVLFAEALDPRVLEAVCHLVRFVRPVLLADEGRVREVIARDLGHVDPNRIEFTLSESAFVDLAKRPELVEEFAREQDTFCAHMGSPVTPEQARAMASEPVRFGIWAARLGHADTVVAGAAHAPKDSFRPMLRLLSAQPVCCEAGVFVLPDEHPEEVFPRNIVVFGDVGVNATMTPEILAEVAVGTCVTARDLIPEDVLPTIHGVLVSYSNRGSDEGPSPELVRKATALIPALLVERVRRSERYATISIEGEVKVSAALSKRSAGYYQHDSRWSGAPNVIIAPNLEMGNLLYHLYATRFPDAKKFPALFGLRFRGVDLSMDCTPEDVRLAVKASVLRMYRYGEWGRTPLDTFFRRHRVLAVNPGSTSTKISVYEGEQERFTTELQHPAEELKPFEGKSITEQYAFRKEIIMKALTDHGLAVDDLDAVAGRGGLLRPIPHGTFAVTDDMLADLRAARYGEHASNLGALIARELTAGSERPAYVVDPVVVDEAPERVKVTGMKAVRRKVISHALNQIATARRYAEERETFYEKVNVIVCHLGGGISVGAHRRGRYIDVNNALDGEGPFTPQRSGSMPTGQMIDLCFSGRYTRPELKQLAKGRGGLIDLLGTADLREVERRMEAGDPDAGRVYEAMAYQIAKEIASLLPAFDGEPVDRILLTGGMARSQRMVGEIARLVAPLGCGVTVYPGENEMLALVKGVLRVLDGKETAREYASDPQPSHAPAKPVPETAK
jgi:butyrate kinase